MGSFDWLNWFEDLCKDHNEIVGKKCAHLGELTRCGFPVPKGFALSIAAYDRFLRDTGVIEEIRRYLHSFRADPKKPGDMMKYEEVSKVIRTLVESKDMPEDMEGAIGAYYDELCRSIKEENVPVATRSAGAASHPGQYETFLHVRGRSAVIEHIIKVWSSTFNTRSLIARARCGLPLEYDAIGVAVLQMVNAKAAGVMFTLNPINGDLSKIMIEGTWGLGEGLVSGEITPDKWTVDKVMLEINERLVSPKLTEYQLDPASGKPCFIDIDPKRQNVTCLDEEEILELAKIGKRIEQHFGEAQDIEWAIDNDLPFPGNVYILQCRPEQVWTKKEKGSKLKLAESNWGDMVCSRFMGSRKDMS